MRKAFIKKLVISILCPCMVLLAMQPIYAGPQEDAISETDGVNDDVQMESGAETPGMIGDETDNPADTTRDTADDKATAKDISATEGMPEDITKADDIQDMSAENIDPLAEGIVGDTLDGDFAYIDIALQAGAGINGYDITTGTAPWDTNDAAGSDTDAYDDVVRTYDTVNYNIGIATHMRDGSEMSGYHSGKVYFEFLLPYSATQAQFEIESMTWIMSKSGAYSITEEEINGQTMQVMRGYYVLTAESDSAVAIGEGTTSVNLTIRALAMDNGDTIAPEATMWLDYNDVGVDYSTWGQAESYTGTVTYDGSACKEHGDVEFKTFTAPNVTVSAVQSYNIALSASSTYQYMGEFDFNTGNTDAINYGLGKTYGRLGSYGICLQIKPRDGGATSDLRGVEMPTQSGDTKIEFDIILSNTMTFDDGPSKVDLTDAYTPLIWSIEGNTNSDTQSDGRNVSITGIKYFSQFPNNKGTTYNSCHDGGAWTARQDGSTVHITVTGYELSLDLSGIPYAAASGAATTHTYYDPTAISDYWEIDNALCFSVGELWVVQPFYTDYENGEGYVLDYNGTTYDSGSFSVTVKNDRTMSVTAEGGTTNVSARTANSVSETMNVGWKTGSLTDAIYYAEYGRAANGYPLTAGCESNDKDWILKGNDLTIDHKITYNNGEGGSASVAFDSLVKFDDEFLDLASSIRGSSSAVKMFGGKTGGWANDKEMIEATTDDLVFFKSLSDLEDAGYTCVAVLVEYHYLQNDNSVQIRYDLDGSAKGEVGNVYMTTQYCRVWTISDLAKAMVDDPTSGFTNATTATDYLIELTKNEIQPYIDEYIPTRSDGDMHTYAEYPEPSIINLGRDGTTSYTASMLNYTKTYYDASGYHAGSVQGKNYVDCCLLVGWDSDLSLHTAQTGSGGDYAQYYDMDTKQYTVDYVMGGTLIKKDMDDEEQESTDTVYMSVDIPKELSYIGGSSYIGGEYTDNGTGTQGSVTGGLQLFDGQTYEYTYGYTNDGTVKTAVIPVTLNVTKNADGTTTLLYTLGDVPVTGGDDGTQVIDDIHFSLDIDPLLVSNNDSLKVVSTIYTKSDLREADTHNTSEWTIRINKQGAVSLLERVSAGTTIAGGTADFNTYLTVTSSAQFEVLLIEALPYGNDTLNGNVYVDAASATATESVMDLSSFTFYYATDESFKDAHSDEWDYSDFTDGTAEAAGWIKASAVTNDNGVTYMLDIPDNTQVYAIAVIGTTTGSSDEGILNVTLTLSFPESVAGNSADSTATQKYTFGDETQTLSSTATTTFVDRRISGTVWLDEDMDGGINTGIYGSETMISGLSAVLQIQDDNGWVDVDTTDTDAEGGYKFDRLDAGQYRIIFRDDKNTYLLSENKPTAYEASGINDELNSKAVNDSGVYAIENIMLPDMEGMDTYEYEVEYQNAGFTRAKETSVAKEWLSHDGNNITDEIEYEVHFTVRFDNGNTYEFNLGPSSWTYVMSMLYYDGSGGALTYSNPVVEEDIGGFLMTYSYNDDTGKIDITNREPYLLPNSGGAGIALIMAAGCAVSLYATLRKRKLNQKS